MKKKERGQSPNETFVSKINIDKVRQLRPFKIDYSEVKTLKYIDQEQRGPQTFKEYTRLREHKKLRLVEKDRPELKKGLRYLKDFSISWYFRKKVLVLVNHDLYPAVQPAITQYVADLAYEGYYATVHTIAGGTPAELRDFIKDRNPMGVVLVGNLPTAWFEMSDDFYGSAEFPCDLYFMDLNGTWEDPDGDGKFSGHPTNVAPEIWVGRLWTPTSSGNDAALINDYFARNHAYRKGRFGYSNKALAFVEDDWIGFDDCAFDYMLSPSNIETITAPSATTGARYKAEVQQHRAWAQINAHSSPGGHSISAPSGGEWIPSAYLRDINPPNAYFYNLFACSNALFTQSDYMAGWYIFDKAGDSSCNGLAAVGSTKTGSMLLFENFYGPMGAGKTIGAAFVDWWKALGTDHDLGERQWYYGMTLLGDPTLNWWTGVVPQPRTPATEDVFDHFPRLTHLNWDPIGLPGVTYNVEIDAFGAIASGKWAAEVGTSWFVSGALTDNNFEHMFVGAQRGRWRVRANVAGRTCPWSDWQYFKYTV
ncbi:MAG TPA: C25 family cysteine peptidase [Candidatus Saccharimonadales bacterium]